LPRLILAFITIMRPFFTYMSSKTKTVPTPFNE
jgi:hypothetical protein